AASARGWTGWGEVDRGRGVRLGTGRRDGERALEPTPSPRTRTGRCGRPNRGSTVRPAPPRACGVASGGRRYPVGVFERLDL
ncbi:MAG: hypothetical protein AVDCRST_MAG59-42, partial [uncultured Thermomicrobiales bacterium]